MITDPAWKPGGAPLRYRYEGQEIEIAERKTIIDAIASSRFIPESKSSELIPKVTEFAGPKRARDLKRNVVVDTNQC